MLRKLKLASLGIFLLGAAALPAQARWWVFGKAHGRPELMRLFIGGNEAGQSEGKIQVYSDQLKEGKVEIKGFFHPAPGSIVSLARVSLDGGRTWHEDVQLAKDSFLYVFEPRAEEIYDVRASVVDAKGKSNDPGDLPRTSFVYHNASGAAVAEEGLRELARRYSNRDYHGFTSLIADDYQGDAGSLEDAVARDFKTFSSIDLSVIPSRTLLSGADAKIDFRFDETVVRSTDSSTSKSSGQATYTLRLEDGRYKLFLMPSPVIFGVTASAGENPHTGGGSDVQSGSGQVTHLGAPFSFKSGTNSSSGDIASGPTGGIDAFSPAGVQPIAYSGSLNNISQAPSSGYQATSSAAVGEIIAVLTQSGTYAVLQITNISSGGFNPTISFDYRYQPDGTNLFQ